MPSMPIKDETIHIVGLGARTAVGLSAPMSAASVRAGLSRIGEHPYMIDRAGEAMVVARATYLSAEVGGVERFVALAEPAVQEALAPLQNVNTRVEPMPFIVGLPAQRPGLPTNLAERVTNHLKNTAHGTLRFSEAQTFLCGHSAGLMAIQEGAQRIGEGRAEFCLVGGIESYLESETLEWLDEHEQLHSEKNKWGFIPGEAAGFCLLASARALEKYRLRTLGRILAAATARETNLIKTDSVCTGEGLTKAFRDALRSLPSQQRVDHVICDMNGERYRADEYGFTVARTSEHFVDATDFLAPADCWGDVGAASGPLFINLAIAASLRGYAKGPFFLTWTSSESGERSATLLHMFRQDRN